ncbi:MAG TPA: RpiB/LacA/LacB family sugar-phosphate isomerase [Candidatus Acidoferrum sp.]|nr:RpiB/LacA/LacB family sugar-phosphate isomerase [Candidatus Acidoferrum sp.]
MRIYVAAEKKGLDVSLANMINRSGHNCIICDDESTEYKDLIKDIRNYYSSYDLSILISASPQDACIEANRIAGIRAVVCKDAEDASSAMSAKSNLIVIDAEKFRTGDTKGIMKSIFDSSGKPRQQTLEPQMAQEPQRRQQPSTGGTLGSLKNAFGMGNAPQDKPMQKQAPVQQPKKVQPVQKQQPQQAPKKKGKSGGFFDSLKDTFGVE